MYVSASEINDSKNPPKVAPSLIAKAGLFTALPPALIGAFNSLIASSLSNSSEAPPEPDVPVPPAPEPKPDVPVPVQEHGNKTWLWITLGCVGIIAVLVVSRVVSGLNLERPKLDEGAPNLLSEVRTTSNLKIEKPKLGKAVPKLNFTKINAKKVKIREKPLEEYIDEYIDEDWLQSIRLDRLPEEDMYGIPPYEDLAGEHEIEKDDTRESAYNTHIRIVKEKMKLAKKYKQQVEAEIAVLNKKVEEAENLDRSEQEIKKLETDVSSYINNFYSQKMFNDFG